MAEAQAERHRKMERGRSAMLAESIAAPYIEDMIWGKITGMVGACRGGSLTHDMMLSNIGGISALMALNDMLEGDQRQGDVAAQKELDNG